VTGLRCFVLLFALPLGACAVSGAGISRNDVAQNQCQDNNDCQPAGGTCNQSEKICQGTNAALTSLLVAVSPPTTLVGVNSFTYFIDKGGDGDRLTGSSRLDLDVAPAVSVNGTVRIDTTPPCLPSWLGPKGESISTNRDDGIIPATVTFTPSQRAFGVPTDSYISKPYNETDPEKMPGYHVQQALPAGQYDIYIEPFPVDDAAQCADDKPSEVPPRLFLHQSVSSILDIKLPAALPLKINVTWPLAARYEDGAEQADAFLANPLWGWTLDLVDQSSGRVLSTVQTLTLVSPPLVGDTSVTYTATLTYSPVYTPGTATPEPVKVGSEIIRLTPPTYDMRFGKDVPYTAPTILAQLDGALVDADGKPAPAQIVQTAPLPTPVTVQFQTGLGDGTPIEAGVLLTAEEIDDISGLSTSFSRTIQVGADGTAAVDLLPGKYRVIASPKSGCADGACLALVETEWVVRATPPSQAGKYIQFEQAQTYDGSVFITGGAPAAGATVHAVASSLFSDPNVLNVGNAAVAVVPRASSGLVDSDGSFSLQADAGVFDLRVEPDPSTGYGWLVKPGFELPARGDELAQNALEVELPIVYRGTVSFSGSDGSPIPKALIRAYAYVKDGKISTKTDGAIAIQVAEAYSEDQTGDVGAFRLLIPRTLDLPAP
jgi:hypothetical protein